MAIVAIFGKIAMALALFHMLADITFLWLTIVVQKSPNPTDNAYIMGASQFLFNREE
jgi:hypothetical protein